MKKFINSNEKEKFKKGKEYWTYYIRLNSKETGFQYYTGIMKVKCIANNLIPAETRFEILKSKKLGRTLAHNIHLYMDGYGISTCNFYEDYDKCVKDHDKDIKNIAKNKSTAVREGMLKKLITKEKPEKKKIEVDSINWYNSLSQKEKKYVKWLNDYYDEI